MSEIHLELDMDKWPLWLHDAYHEQTGVTATLALTTIGRAVPDDGVRPGEPAPDAFLAIPIKWFTGLVWAAHRMAGEKVSFAAFEQSMSYDKVMGEFWAAMPDGDEDEPEPEPVPLAEGATTDSPPTANASGSAPTTSGRKRKSTS